jgi:hypothetical protein
LGFADFEVNKNYTVQPGEQTIGAGVATKKITENGKTYTLIAIVPRSAGYEKEWAGNFTIGDGSNSDGFAEGFYNAMTEVVRFSADYIQRHGISGDTKIWTVGYSRGAATANLTAGWYADHAASDPRLTNISLQREDIYAYTFGTPAGVHYDIAAEKEALHTNYAFIHNIFAAYDPVSMLALDQWGFTRYGTDHTLNAGYDTSSHQDTNTSAMLSYLKQLNALLAEGTDYRTESGSTRLWISPKYLNQLSVGTHTLSAYYIGYDGPVTAEFTIENAKEEYSEIVNTSAPGLDNWIILFGLSTLMAAGCLMVLKKYRTKLN